MARRRRDEPSAAVPGGTARSRHHPRHVAICVPNLFLFVPVEAAVKGAGAVPVAVRQPEEVEHAGCGVLVVDLGELGEAAATRLAPLCRAGVVVLAFGPHVEGPALAAARAVGAVALPRSAFFPRLPELLELALGSAGRKGTPAGRSRGRS